MSDMSDAAAEAMERLGAAIAETSKAHSEDGVLPLVTRFYVIAETIDEQGQTSLEGFRSRDCSLWDALGMMDFESTIERGKIEHGC